MRKWLWLILKHLESNVRKLLWETMSYSDSTKGICMNYLALEEAMEAQRRSRGTDLLFL
jgi:hypothetical protein